MKEQTASLHLVILYSLTTLTLVLIILQFLSDKASDLRDCVNCITRCSVISYGAVGDGIADDTAAIKRALDENLHTCFPSGVFRITESLRLKNGQILSGTGISQALTKSPTGGTKLVFSGGVGYGSAISGRSENVSIQHIQIKDLAIHVEDQYEWVIDLKNPVGCDFSDLEIATRNKTTGGIRTTKTQGISWVNNFINVQVRLPNLSNASNLDLSHGDFHIFGGNFSGGTGAIIGGTGGDRVVGSRFDNAGLHPDYNKYDTTSPIHPMREKSAGLRIKAVNRFRQPVLSANQIENNGKYDLVIDADVSSYESEDILVLPIIANNIFRSFHADASIYLKNEQGRPVSGGIIQGNSFNSENEYIVFDETRWSNVVVGPNYYREGKYASLPKLTQAFLSIDHTGINLPNGNFRIGNVPPENNIKAPPGTIYLNSNGGKNATLYIKEIGTDDIGWAAK